jgi:hypothetical protein
MSSDESKRKSPQGQQERSKQDKGPKAEHEQRHSDDPSRPLPFDDAGGTEDVVSTTSPQKPPMDAEF